MACRAVHTFRAVLHATGRLPHGPRALGGYRRRWPDLASRVVSAVPNGRLGQRALCSGPARITEQELRQKASEGAVEGTRVAEAYAMAFTCCVCNTRSAKKISKRSYHHGVVIVQCPNCKNRHLIADHFKWFGDDTTDIEKIMREKGEEVVRLNQYKLADSDAADVLIHVEGLQVDPPDSRREEANCSDGVGPIGPPLMPAPTLPDTESILDVVRSAESESSARGGDS